MAAHCPLLPAPTCAHVYTSSLSQQALSFSAYACVRALLPASIFELHFRDHDLQRVRGHMTRVAVSDRLRRLRRVVRTRSSALVSWGLDAHIRVARVCECACVCVWCLCVCGVCVYVVFVCVCGVCVCVVFVCVCTCAILDLIRHDLQRLKCRRRLSLRHHRVPVATPAQTSTHIKKTY